MTPDKIKSNRARLGITQKELADRLGVSLGAVRKWEQGDRECKGAALTLMKIIFEEKVIK